LKAGQQDVFERKGSLWCRPRDLQQRLSKGGGGLLTLCDGLRPACVYAAKLNIKAIVHRFA
jgi:hypothetical protein